MSGELAAVGAFLLLPAFAFLFFIIWLGRK